MLVHSRYYRISRDSDAYMDRDRVIATVFKDSDMQIYQLPLI